MNEVHISRITVPEDRQRKEFPEAEQEALKGSIQEFGLLNPLVVHKSTDLHHYELIAGERRLRALKDLGYEKVKIVYFEDLTIDQQRKLELEENIRRVDLTWQEKAQAVSEYHKIRVRNDPKWTGAQTAQALRLSPGYISKIITVSEHIPESPNLAKSATIASAYNQIKRKQSRVLSTELELLDAIDTEPEGKQEEEPELNLPQEDSVIHKDFHEWASTYKGPRFNLIHCDFPYGVGIDKSDAMRTKSGEVDSYEDDPETYFKLVNTLLDHQDQIISTSAHMLFWFSMSHYWYTMNNLVEAGWVVNPFPLIWTKSDGKGILPDAKRGRRRVYETCLLCTRGDRYIVSAVNNFYSCPTGGQHQTEKPEPMLKHFFRMLVDNSTRLLDPTCGSGTSLRAAESLGAARVFGMDINPESVELANHELNKARRLAKLSKEV